MVFVTTIKGRDGVKDEFSKEKIAIMFFESQCALGEPNLNLAEKLAFLVCDKVNAKFSKEVPAEKLEEIIKETLTSEGQNDLLLAYLLQKATSNTQQSNSEIRDAVFRYILGLSDSENIQTRLACILGQLNRLQSNQHEKTNKKIFEYLKEGVFYPSTCILKGLALNQHLLSGYAFSVPDSIEGIFDVLAKSSIAQKYGLPISIELSEIRSEKEKVKSINRNACGPGKVVDLFVSAKSIVGYSSSSANNLYYISIEHPDIVSFLSQPSSKPRDNFAITVPDRFMKAFSENVDYFVEQGQDKKIKVCPQAILDLISSRIITGEHINLIFQDTVNKKNPFLGDSKRFMFSPVGLQPIFENSSFASGVIDVSKFVNCLGNTKTIDWVRLKAVIWDAIEFLDNTIELSRTLNDINSKELKETRQIYLSITGFYSLLAILEIPYSSDDAVCLAEALSQYINYYSKLRSTELAKERGPFFKFINSKYELPNFGFEKAPIQKRLFSEGPNLSKKLLKNMPSMDWIELKNNIKKYGLRNSTTFSIIFSDLYSIAGGVTNAVNPLTSYKSIVWINGQKFEKLDSVLSSVVSGIKPSWSVQELESAIQGNIKEKLELSRDISTSAFIRLQATFEKNTDGCVNMNIYFSDNSVIQGVKDAIAQAHKCGCSLFLPEKLNCSQTDFLQDGSANLMSL